MTSTAAMMRVLDRRWRQLHNLVYIIAPLGVLHFLWLVKKDRTEPLIFAAVLGVMLGARLIARLSRKSASQNTTPP